MLKKIKNDRELDKKKIGVTLRKSRRREYSKYDHRLSNLNKNQMTQFNCPTKK